LVVARDGKTEVVYDVFAVEFHALEQGVDAAAEVGAIRAVFETD
jgi:hypothetical protein